MNYIYYLRTNSIPKDLFRVIDNGKGFDKNFGLIEKFENDGSWNSKSKVIRTVFDEIMTGWFDEDNRISEDKAIEIMQLISKKNKFIEARLFAIERHGEQTYGTLPYIVHLNAVVSILLRFGLDLNNPKHIPLLNSAWLHDILEDTSTSVDEIEALFGKETAEIVFCVTDGDGETRQKRKKELYKKIITNQKAISLKLADRIANVEACLLDSHKKLTMYKTEHSEFINVLLPYIKTDLGRKLMNYLNRLLNL